MLDFSPDKRGAILKASFDVFITYGFRKTSMDDIAKAAGMSRPALYQQFRNKTDIFRELVCAVSNNAAANAEQAFTLQKPFGERLFDAIDGQRSIAEILDTGPVRMDRSQERARAFFKRLWWYDQVVFDASYQPSRGGADSSGRS